jgi:hypothetical protein
MVLHGWPPFDVSGLPVRAAPGRAGPTWPWQRKGRPRASAAQEAPVSAPTTRGPGGLRRDGAPITRRRPGCMALPARRRLGLSRTAGEGTGRGELSVAATAVATVAAKDEKGPPRDRRGMRRARRTRQHKTRGVLITRAESPCSRAMPRPCQRRASWPGEPPLQRPTPMPRQPRPRPARQRRLAPRPARIGKGA